MSIFSYHKELSVCLLFSAIIVSKTNQPAWANTESLLSTTVALFLQLHLPSSCLSPLFIAVKPQFWIILRNRIEMSCVPNWQLWSLSYRVRPCSVVIPLLSHTCSLLSVLCSLRGLHTYLVVYIELCLQHLLPLPSLLVQGPWCLPQCQMFLPPWLSWHSSSTSTTTTVSPNPITMIISGFNLYL